MKHSDTKKRRLAALSQGYGSATTGQNATTAAAAAAAQQVQQPQAAQVADVQPHFSAAANSSQAPGTTVEEMGVFPYNPIDSTITTFQAAVQNQLSTSSCKGSIDDILEQLMIPNMPPHVARNMIATRTVDKSVVLDNPTAKLNITRPSNSHKGGRQLLSANLLPRAKRQELSRLPTSGLDFTTLTALHELWGKYMSNLLDGKPDVERLLQTADWHGAIMTVTSSPNKIYTGRSGIVVKVTSNTFVLVGTDGRSSVVPLKGAVVECVVPGVGQPVVLQGNSSTKLQCSIKVSGST